MELVKMGVRQYCKELGFTGLVSILPKYFFGISLVGIHVVQPTSAEEIKKAVEMANEKKIKQINIYI